MPTVTIGSNSGDTYSGCDSAYMQQVNPSTNFGGSGSLYSTKWAASDHSHTVLKFGGVSNIPSSAIVSAAKVKLYLNSSIGSGSQTHDLRRLLRTWVEAEVTWDIYSTGNNWATGGGLGAADRDSTVLGSASVGTTTGTYYDFTGSGLTTLVQDWVSGAVANQGLHLERNGTGNDSTHRSFTSDEGSDGTRPVLEVTYTLPISHLPHRLHRPIWVPRVRSRLC